jgi:hypothetical protein
VRAALVSHKPSELLQRGGKPLTASLSSVYMGRLTRGCFLGCFLGAA